MSNEASGKTRRGVRVYDSNPFLQSGLVKPKTKRITNRRGDMMVVGETGEIVAPIAGFWQAEEVDSSKFIKLYVNGVRAFKDLTNAGTRVLKCSISKCKGHRPGSGLLELHHPRPERQKLVASHLHAGHA